MWLYTLKLSQGMYYVGTTDDLDKRISQHASGNGSAWTRTYPYVAVLKTRQVHSTLEEDLEVKKLMQKHGIDRVRGGTYSSLSLSDEQKSSLQRELDHADSKCIRCGRDSHWVAQCYAKRHVNGQELGGVDGVSFQKRNFQGEGGAGGGYKRCRYEERGEDSENENSCEDEDSEEESSEDGCSEWGVEWDEY